MKLASHSFQLSWKAPRLPCSMKGRTPAGSAAPAGAEKSGQASVTAGGRQKSRRKLAVHGRTKFSCGK
jgi:hypothetical protein